MEKFRKRLIPIAAVTLVAVILFVFVKSDLKHIEDTNGPDNFKLNTITDAQIIDMDMGSINAVSVRKDLIGDGLTFYSNKFTGVYEVLYDNLIGKSDFVLSFSSLTVTEGNFRMVVVHDGRIVAEFEPNAEDPFVDYMLEDVSGTVSLRIVGESAAYSFHMSAYEYDNHAHSDDYAEDEYYED